MTGRGVDQILPHPGNPELWEPYVRDARDYVRLAERVSGRFPRPVDFGWPWGDALAALDDVAPDARLINLETSVTRAGTPAEDKRLHYRMSPMNLPCLSAARPDVCALANNHVLDFGPSGLTDTRDALAGAGLAVAGAGQDSDQAEQPAVVGLPTGNRLIVIARGSESSGIPRDWAASAEQAGVALLPDLSEATADALLGQVRPVKRPGDVVVVSVHWGSNWGYHVPEEQVRFAHALIDGGVAIVHGHSSHHPRPIETYRGRLVLHGCGDLINDYEGIGGYQEYRGELRLLYLASVQPATGELARLSMVPLRARRMRLHRADVDEAAHLCRVLDRISRPFGTRIGVTADSMLERRGSG